MALSFALEEAAVRTALRADILAAWSPARIYDDPAEIEQAPGTLPEAYLYLLGTEDTDEVGGMREAGITLLYEIALRAPRPASGTIHAAKIAKAEALRARLVSAATYGGWNRQWLGETYISSDPEQREAEATQPWYTLAVRFAVSITVASF